MKRVVVTGGSGKAGRWVVKRLVDAGYEVKNVDLVPLDPRFLPRPEPGLKARSLGTTGSGGMTVQFQRVDLTEYGQAVDALRGADAVVHLAAIPAPRMATDEVTFRTNVTSTYNVFQAALTLGLKRVVWASSETTLGLPFDRVLPDYAPIDEACTRFPETAYALSKVTGEELAIQFSRWSGMPIIGLRFSNVIEPGDYARFRAWQDDPHARKWNMWGYVDARDCGLACQRALEVDTGGLAKDGPSDSGSSGLAQAFIIAAANTVMTRPSVDLLAEVFPKVRVKGRITGRMTLLSIEKARRMLGYEPEHDWEDELRRA